ncbi:hypothetical protein HRI_002614900 [Hibiscus trionum]|uniref:Transposase, Ptta/En/Spm, plant n=1 Tax=Hibiscus trionum TaxID=183268 RepID=A0A9W7I6H6_HIBTR|nr:hypothetical protein HRI_002614900 [Hibiscus trionum]
MAPGKIFKKKARTQSTCNPVSKQKNRQTTQELVFDDLNQTQELEPQQVTDAQDQTHEEINLDTTNENPESTNLSRKRVRGPSRGKGLENLIKGNNKLVVEIAEGKGRPTDVVQSAKLSSEIRIISRQFSSIPTKWKDITDNEKIHALERLKSKFEMKLDDEYVKNSVMSIMSKLSRNHRHQVHLHFKTFPNAAIARQNKPTKYNLTQENWDKLCDLFSDPKYQRRCETNARVRRNVKLTPNQGSRAFVASRYAMRKDGHEPNRIDFFKATHYSNDKGWTTHEAQTTYEKMVELQSTSVEEGVEPKTVDDIADEVLGTRSGYIPGLGYGPKPNKRNLSADTIELQKRLKNKEDELIGYKTNFEVLQTQMEAMRSALIAVGIQVPSLQSSGKQYT